MSQFTFLTVGMGSKWEDEKKMLPASLRLCVFTILNSTFDLEIIIDSDTVARHNIERSFM